MVNYRTNERRTGAVKCLQTADPTPFSMPGAVTNRSYRVTRKCHKKWKTK